MIDVTCPGDPYLPEAGLWLDPHRPRPLAFVSHAHADHFSPHEVVIASEGTAHLIADRYSSRVGSVVALPFGEWHECAPGFRLRLLPAGHIAGSAMCLIERIDDGATLLHTGDFKTRASFTSEPCEPVEADALIMETTFGIPKFRFPPRDNVVARMAVFASDALEENLIPVFHAYSLGKAQEILFALHHANPAFAFHLHSSVAKMTRSVAELGVSFPKFDEFDPKERDPAGHVVIIPPASGRGQALRKLKKRVRSAMVSGWGIDAGARFRYQVDEVFPLSDHADYDDLLSFVEKVNPKVVHTIHGYTREFAQDLRRRGIEAWPLQPVTQLELDLERATLDTPASEAGESTESESPPDPEHGFGRFDVVCREVGASAGKLRKQEILAAYLRDLDGGHLATAVAFLAGRPFPRQDGPRAAQAGWAVIRRALLEVTGLSEGEYRRISTSQADASRTAHLLLHGRTEPRPHTLEEIRSAILDVAEATGPAPKIERLSTLLREMHHSEGARVVGILTGDLRIGLQEGLLEEAVALAFDRLPKEVREAHMLLGDLGETAQLAREDRLGEAGVTWFTPLKVMLASPSESATEIADRLGDSGEGIWLEDKFDGIRAQIHRRGERVEIYSRDLRPLTVEFPELIAPARSLEHDVILDGEIIAFADGKKLTFFDLQKRLGRRDQGDLFFGEAIPVRFIAFDLLAIDGESLLERPLCERRARLERIAFHAPFSRCELYRADSPEAIDEAFNAARRRDNEGLIAKDPASPYTPGRRGKSWLKLKKAMPTLDCVVVRAEQGHGKRAHVLSDYTFAVRDEDSGELRVVGKAYSGLTDEEIETLTEHFIEKTIEKKRRVRIVEPDVVLEIAFDSIQASKRHDSGLAMRFPRIHAIRHDKTIADIDTLAYARKLAGVA